MSTYTILRHVGLEFTHEDLDAASLRALVCAYEFRGLKWVRSYWDVAGGDIFCDYEASGPEQLREHARRSRIPCDEVREIREFGPGDYAEMGAPVTVPASP